MKKVVHKSETHYGEFGWVDLAKCRFIADAKISESWEAVTCERCLRARKKS